MIGFTGVGKSTVTEKLAAILGLKWIDTDDEIEKILGDKIYNVVQVDNGQLFKQVETKVLKEASCRTDVIVSTGAGSVIPSENQHIFRSNLTFFLKDNLDDIYNRAFDRGANKPMKELWDFTGFKKEYFRIRQIYQECAIHSLNLPDQTEPHLVKQITETVSLDRKINTFVDKIALFDDKKYLKYNLDLEPSKINAFEHFIKHGIKQNRNFGLEELNAGPLMDFTTVQNELIISKIDRFNPTRYLWLNSDVEKAGVDPYQHFVEFGIKENRNFGCRLFPI